MNANDIAFGIELETTMPGNDDTPVGPYHGGWQVPWLPTGWKAERDGSIQPMTPDRKGCEFVSPKMLGANGLTEVALAVDAINARGGRVNQSCGLHITITWNGDAAATARLITLVGNYEKAIYASTGTTRRETGRYTKGVKQYGGCTNARMRCTSDRYHVINLTHLAQGKNRIEFRAFAGTLNKTKIIGYIMMILGFAELALTNKRSTSWDYTKKPGTNGPWDRNGAGAGETEINRLFYRLGWTKGHAKGGKRYGEVGTPNWDTIKGEFRRLAKKYDAEVAGA